MTMQSNTEQRGLASFFDFLKWTVVIVLVVGGIIGNWYFQDESLLVRAIALVVVALIATFVLFQTEQGRVLWEMAKEARVEVRRVVWPTRQETSQTTVIVLVLIGIFALILWALDSMLAWFVQALIG